MGCDIHIHAEIKIAGVWHHWNQPRVDRNYELFGKMAGVRDYNIDPIAKPRGVPDDASFTTKFDFGRHGDYHTPSWLSAAEVVEVSEWFRERNKKYGGFVDLFGFICGNTWDIEKYRSDYPVELEDARIVFWFDS